MSSGTNVAALGLGVLIVMCGLTWGLSRRNAVMPLLIMTAYMPLGQEFVVFGLNLQFFRIVLLVGLCRVGLRGEAVGLRLTTIDRVFIWWAIVTLVMGTLAELSVDRFVSRAGVVLNALGSYFLARCWIRTMDDIISVVRWLAWLMVPLASFMMLEKLTGRNAFAIFGGVPEFTGIREGRLRCQGAFRHPILAGTYGATMFPLFVGLWFTAKQYKRAALCGAISAVVVTVAASSSGALLALMTAGCGLLLWRFRPHMRTIRYAILAAVIVLAVIMNAPVWYLFARLSEVVGGTGWYRSYIIDVAIEHFSEWWLVGSTYTAHWAPAGEVVPGDPNNMDIINNYVAEGLGGGIAKLGLFVATIVLCFKTVGPWVIQPQDDLPKKSGPLVWAFGVALAAHCVSFLSVAYFDQIVVMWYWLLATFSLLSEQDMVAPENEEGMHVELGGHT